MADNKQYRIETLAIHAGQVPDPTTLSRAVPVYRTTAYAFRNSKHGADLFGLRETGNIYARLMNPTEDVLEQRLAALDGGKAALAVSSGTAAIYFTITNIARQGDEIVAANNRYGGTYTQFDAILPQSGIKVNFTPVNDFEAVERAINERTRAIYIETVGNPGLDIADIEAYAKIAQKHHLPLIVDSTFTPPTLLRPIEHGANIVIHSLSFILRLRTGGLRNQGPTLAPDAAWIFLQGLESLPLRTARHSENGLAVANFLKNHPKAAWVKYPGFQPLAKKYLPDGANGMVVFGVKGGAEAAQKLVDNVALFTIIANVGDAKSLIIHPASTTHSQLSEEDQIKAGLPPELIRLSIGLENVDDIIGALDDALKLI